MTEPVSSDPPRSRVELYARLDANDPRRPWADPRRSAEYQAYRRQDPNNDNFAWIIAVPNREVGFLERDSQVFSANRNMAFRVAGTSVVTTARVTSLNDFIASGRDYLILREGNSTEWPSTEFPPGTTTYYSVVSRQNALRLIQLTNHANAELGLAANPSIFLTTPGNPNIGQINAGRLIGGNGYYINTALVHAYESDEFYAAIRHETAHHMLEHGDIANLAHELSADAASVTSYRPGDRGCDAAILQGALQGLRLAEIGQGEQTDGSSVTHPTIPVRKARLERYCRNTAPGTGLPSSRH